MNPYDLIKYITWYATENEINLSTNRLVKMIYLADLFHARLKNGQTITGFPWQFVYYGPYCQEAMRCIDDVTTRGFVCKETFESRFADNKDYHIFSCHDEDAEKLENQIHLGVIGPLQQAIKELGNDTPKLFDYVYFETEPMKNVRKGDLLDFTKARRLNPFVRKQPPQKITPEKIKLARDLIKRISSNVEADKKKLLQDRAKTEKYKDDLFYQFIEISDGKELEVGLQGTAKIILPE